MNHVVDVRGDFACFSRPEGGKVERFSYPCPTPSGGRGILEAIYFKPQFYWQVERIELLREPAYIALRRNEVGSVASVSNVKSWMKRPEKVEPLIADDPAMRQQRQTMALRNPRFRVTARIMPRSGHESQKTAFDDQFVRRASQGKCWMQPCFGCREFVAFFRLVRDISDEPSPVDYSQDVGWMLYDVFDLRRANGPDAKPFVTIFRAKIDHGVLDVPPFDSDAVLKPEDASDAKGRAE